MTIQKRSRQVHRVACAYFGQRPDWVSFFREMLGKNGAVRVAFPDQESLTAFELTEEYADIQRMLAKLREEDDLPPPEEPTRVITVRIPVSLHETLRAEAHGNFTSMNKLCISKLVQLVDSEYVPTEKGLAPPKASTAP
jgi:predicted HicB family RNase H-like nuclease